MIRYNINIKEMKLGKGNQQPTSSQSSMRKFSFSKVDINNSKNNTKTNEIQSAKKSIIPINKKPLMVETVIINSNKLNKIKQDSKYTKLSSLKPVAEPIKTLDSNSREKVSITLSLTDENNSKTNKNKSDQRKKIFDIKVESNYQSSKTKPSTERFSYFKTICCKTVNDVASLQTDSVKNTKDKKSINTYVKHKPTTSMSTSKITQICKNVPNHSDIKLQKPNNNNNNNNNKNENRIKSDENKKFVLSNKSNEQVKINSAVAKNSFNDLFIVNNKKKFTALSNLNKENKVDFENIKMNLELQIFNIYGQIKLIPNSATKPRYHSSLRILKPRPPDLNIILDNQVDKCYSLVSTLSSSSPTSSKSLSSEDESTINSKASSFYYSSTLTNNNNNNIQNFNLFNYMKPLSQRVDKLDLNSIDFDTYNRKNDFGNDSMREMLNYKYLIQKELNTYPYDLNNDETEQHSEYSMYDEIFKIYNLSNNQINDSSNSKEKTTNEYSNSNSSIDSDLDDEDITLYNQNNSSDSNSDRSSCFDDASSDSSSQRLTRQNRVVLFESNPNTNGFIRYEANLPLLPDTISLDVDDLQESFSNSFLSTSNIRKNSLGNNMGRINNNPFGNKDLLDAIAEEDAI